MLSELYIKNYALIENANISFSSGLNVFTGETGAGKSLIMDCIGLVIGGRASSEMVRTGCDSTLIEAVFENADLIKVASMLQENDLDLDLDEEIILSREIYQNGKSRARVNGKLVPLQVLTNLGEVLLNIYGQHENQILSRPSQHLNILDSFGSKEILDLYARFSNAYAKWRDVSDMLSNIVDDNTERARRLDVLKHQVDEIDSYELSEDEDIRLLEESNALANFDKINFELKRAYSILAGDGDMESRSVQDLMSEAELSLSSVATCDESLNEIYKLISESSSSLNEAARQTRRYLDNFEFDEERLNFVEERLDNISKLKRKYGESIADILEFSNKCKEEITSLEFADRSVFELSQQLDLLNDEVFNLAEELSSARKKAALLLEKEVSKQLKDLCMVNSALFVKCEDTSNGFELTRDGHSITVNSRGKDSVELLFSANLGEPPKPLAKVASGGELSRIMLAIKSSVFSSDDMATMIFDEVDQGVGGRAANAVADKLVNISKDRQVIVVTHLPQVASRAKRHFLVEKSVFLDRTNVDVKVLEKQDRIEEIARIIGGKTVTKITYDAAREILEQSCDS